MKKLFMLVMVFALVLSFAMNVEGAKKNYGMIPLFSDSVISTGDSVKTFASATYFGVDNSYGTEFGGKPLFTPLTTKLVVWIDTVAASTDSADIDIELAYKINALGTWSGYTSVTTVTMDSIRLPLVYDLPALFSDAILFADSFRVFVDGDTDNDKAKGVMTKVYFGYGETGY